MPNHVKNILSFDVEGDELLSILERIKNDEIGIGSIDFNKIIPVPEFLKVVPGFSSAETVSFYLTAINPNLPYLGVDKLTNDAFDELCCKIKNVVTYEKINSFLTEDQVRSTIKTLQDYLLSNDTPYEDFKNYMMLTGRQYAENIAHLNAVSFQNFCWKEWGTKWNGYDIYEYDGGQNITFFTAWSPPTPIIQKLSEWHPDVPILHQWADEDLGFNVGQVEYYKNEKSMEKIPSNRSKAAYEIGATIWDINLLENDYRVSDDGSTYVFEEYSSEKMAKQNEFGEEIKPESKENIADRDLQEETGGMKLCL